ncbi:hypothetical protein [Rhizobium leucaenae]|jgi:hypothetical protein|uniref:Uncharacterized protein n=1 Tax=Rhizobium leucaenae TaxID=29450 RepID=A0A7W6ZQ81_9HYPH|nr:hypothetical protein [Rhizobium leucaenae]MBB4566736.1 hypothetical protein [Rhizobium leucaenae]MBB6301370.1 hypothetical protein [Rhizobium leucaenae]
MANQKRIDEMSQAEKTNVLLVLSKTLHLSAMIARRSNDGSWDAMEQLSDRLLTECEAIAADEGERAITVVHEAIRLLGEFELSNPHISVTRH